MSMSMSYQFATAKYRIIKAQMRTIHYPQCWDTSAYPTLQSALDEISPDPISEFKCKVCNVDHIICKAQSFQQCVMPWMLECFGEEIASDQVERNHRFFEEATELVQSGGMTREAAHQLVDYTYDRPVGELDQEVGGVMVTLAALCLAHNTDMHLCGDIELARIWTKIDQIRAKQASKPKHSPLPSNDK